MSKQRAYVALLLDRSGSMDGHKAETVIAINSYIDNTQENFKGLFTLTQFDSMGIDVLQDGVKIKEAIHLTDESYQPRGMTPLLDAIGKTIMTMDTAGFDNVIFCIITDGQENASHEWKLANVRLLLEEKIASGWQVSYLGANVDVFAEGAALGIAGGQSMSFKGAHTAAVMDSYAASNVRYATRADPLDVSSADFTEDERDKSSGGSSSGA